MFACLIQPVIDLGDIGPVFQMIWRIKAESAEIQAAILAVRRVVADGILIQELLISRIQSDAERIDVGQLRGEMVCTFPSVRGTWRKPFLSDSEGTACTCATLLASMRCSQLAK